MFGFCQPILRMGILSSSRVRLTSFFLRFFPQQTYSRRSQVNNYPYTLQLIYTNIYKFSI
uniref:Uncharacterized protein n=1 Tax=Anguilla anguilla TaxID=7936 RepID=A0A0E9RKG2_ANGAN